MKGKILSLVEANDRASANGGKLRTPFTVSGPNRVVSENPVSLCLGNDVWWTVIDSEKRRYYLSMLERMEVIFRNDKVVQRK